MDSGNTADGKLSRSHGHMGSLTEGTIISQKDFQCFNCVPAPWEQNQTMHHNWHGKITTAFRNVLKNPNHHRW